MATRNDKFFTFQMCGKIFVDLRHWLKFKISLGNGNEMEQKRGKGSGSAAEDGTSLLNE